jgi:hypothetical protein
MKKNKLELELTEIEVKKTEDGDVYFDVIDKDTNKSIAQYYLSENDDPRAMLERAKAHKGQEVREENKENIDLEVAAKAVLEQEILKVKK